jgi:hypothetical protein
LTANVATSMKKIIAPFLTFLVLSGPMSCKQDDTVPAFVTAPEAEAGNDNKSGGVYKGTLIATAMNTFAKSTGTFKLVLQGGKEEFTLQIDGVTRTLTTTDLDGWTSGEEIQLATFINGDWSMVLNLSGDGTVMLPNFIIPGYQSMSLQFLKEKSDALVTVYEGTYTGTESGVWNFLIQGQSLLGIKLSTDENYSGIGGSVSGRNVQVSFSTVQGGATGTGTLSGNSFTGTWTQPVGQGAWTATRTL